jgi:peptidoglycan hydrolase-like protein with peptidoglycan-binding domain
MSANDRGHAVMSEVPPLLFPIEPILQEGDSGFAVVELQQLLNTKGAFLVVDGIFGRVTRAAVTKFQRQHGLEPTGIVQPATWVKLRQP